MFTRAGFRPLPSQYIHIFEQAREASDWDVKIRLLRMLDLVPGSFKNLFSSPVQGLVG